MTHSENMLKWIKFLRETDLPQTHGALSRWIDATEGKAGYCCLGIGCEVSGVVKVERSRSKALRQAGYVAYEFDGEVAIAPRSFIEWLGLKFDFGPDIRRGNLRVLWPEGLAGLDDELPYNLTDLNDRLQLTFSQIADVIEYFGVEVYW